MPADPPIDFEALAKRGGSSATGGYPYQIAARDLMANFVFCALDCEDSLVENTSGKGGHRQRKLKISPGTATGQLAFWDGTRWVPTATPSTQSLLQWDGSAWAFVAAPSTGNSLLYWNGTTWLHVAAAPASGTHVLGAVNGALTWIATEGC
jgi:hypothetical protein